MNNQSKEKVRLQVRDGVADVRFNRPEKKNAMDADTFEQLISTADKIASNHSIRAVVLSGEGAVFSAGIDVSMFMQASGAADIAQRLFAPHRHGRNIAQSAAMVWRDVPVPVIAALRGVAFGGALQVALGADIRVAEADARLSVMEMRWGIIPDMGITQTLPRLVRDDVARELTYTGRTINGEEAQRLGLVTQVTENARKTAFEIAERIVNQNPDAIRRAKQLYNHSWPDGGEPGVALEATLQKEILGQPNQMEAMLANLQKRQPNFKDG